MISTEKYNELHIVVELQQESLIAREEAEVMYSSVKLLFCVCVYGLGVQQICPLNDC